MELRFCHDDFGPTLAIADMEYPYFGPEAEHELTTLFSYMAQVWS